jgi:hypothetical protein
MAKRLMSQVGNVLNVEILVRTASATHVEGQRSRSQGKPDLLTLYFKSTMVRQTGLKTAG